MVRMLGSDTHMHARNGTHMHARIHMHTHAHTHVLYTPFLVEARKENLSEHKEISGVTNEPLTF